MSSRSSSSSFSDRQFKGQYKVGWVQDAHGLKGELFIRLLAGVAEWREEANSLSLLKPGAESLTEFTVRALKPHKDGVIASFHEITNRTPAESWVKASVYVAEAILTAEPGESLYLRQIQGFEVVDKTLGAIGKVEGFSSNGPQDLLRVRRPSGKESLIPLVDAFLVHIDFDKQSLSMDLPPGLVDLEE